MFDDDIPMSNLFFSISGSTYRRRISHLSNITSTRFRVCVTVPILEHLHEVSLVFLSYLLFTGIVTFRR